jgi:hypothetical protein
MHAIQALLMAALCSFGLLTFLIFLGRALAEEVTIYGRDWNMRERIKNGKIYDRNWNLKGRIGNEIIFDRNWNTKGYIKKGK